MWSPTREKRKNLIGLILIMILALSLRFVSVGRDSLWLDESISYLTANLSTVDILNNTIKDPHPPFYYFLLHFWLKFVPDSDLTVRSLSIILNVLLIPLVYVLTLDFLGKRPLALLAGFLIAISPFHITYSQELRMYTLLLLVTTFIVWSYWRAINDGKWYWWFLFFLSSLLAIYTHLFSFFLLAGIGVYALINYQKRRELIITVLIGLALAILFIPWLSILVGESQIEIGSLRPLRNTSNNPVKSIIVFTFLLFGQSTTLWYSGAALFLTVATLIIVAMEMRRIRQTREASAILLLVMLVLCIIGFPVIFYHIRPFFLPERTMAAASPFLLILLTWGTTRRQSPLPYLTIATAITMLAGTLVYLLGGAQKPPYRDVIQFVIDNRAAGDVVLHTSDGSYLPALRYTKIPDHVVLAGDPDQRKPLTVYQAFGGKVWDQETVVNAGKRLWVIVALEHSIDWQLTQAKYFAEKYPSLIEQDFDGIKVYLYDLE